jgi:hypothetical protein
MASRRILLGIALAATFAAAFIDWPAPEAAPQARAGTTSAVPPAPAATATVAAVTTFVEPAPADNAPPLRERFDAQAADAFAPRNWQPPPPPPPKPEPPKAPPLPFKYLGKVMQEGEVMAFLGHGARTHLARAGDILADYRIEDITSAGMTLVYLPLNEKQRLTFGSEN